MDESQVDVEVNKFLYALENMESFGIINLSEKSQLRTKIKAWAYDEIKRVKEDQS